MPFPVRHSSHGGEPPRALAAVAPAVPAETRGWPNSDAGDSAFVVPTELAEFREFIGFPRRAVRRHAALAAAIVGAMLLLGVAAAVALPKHYIIETVLLAQKNVVMPALGNPDRRVPTDADVPSRLAAEAVLKRENFISLVRQTNLLQVWPTIRTPGGKLKDAIRARIKGPMTEEDRVEALVGILHQRMWVTPTEGTVRIGIDWMDAKSGLAIVEAAQQNFFEQRHASEVGMIEESIRILSGHVADSERAIEQAVREINATQRAIKVPTLRTGPAPRSSAERATDDRVASLQAALTAKRQTITTLESTRIQRLADEQQKLAELRNTFGTAHPAVEAAAENVKALSTESSQLPALRAEERDVAAQLSALGAQAASASTSPEVVAARAAIEELMRVRSDSLEDPKLTYARSRLKIATSDYETLLDRMESARIELETAKAAFRFRYDVINPALLPKRPDKPNVVLLIAGGLFVGVVLAVFAAMALDLASGRVVERWQVGRQLGLPVLAQVRT